MSFVHLEPSILAALVAACAAYGAGLLQRSSSREKLLYEESSKLRAEYKRDLDAARSELRKSEARIEELERKVRSLTARVEAAERTALEWKAAYEAQRREGMK